MRNKKKKALLNSNSPPTQDQENVNRRARYSWRPLLVNNTWVFCKRKSFERSLRGKLWWTPWSPEKKLPLFAISSPLRSSLTFALSQLITQTKKLRGCPQKHILPKSKNPQRLTSNKSLSSRSTTPYWWYFNFERSPSPLFLNYFKDFRVCVSYNRLTLIKKKMRIFLYTRLYMVKYPDRPKSPFRISHPNSQRATSFQSGEYEYFGERNGNQNVLFSRF